MTATKRYRPTKESIYVLCRVMICVIAFAAFAVLQTDPAAAAATNYNVWVGGTQVTSANCSSSKTWTYAPATRTLTLNNYTYSGTGKKVTFDSEEELYVNGGICAKQDLNLVINGTNKVTGTYLNDETINAGICVKGDLTVSGSGSLTAAGGTNNEDQSAGMYICNGTAVIRSGNVTANGGKSLCSSYGILMEVTEAAYEASELETFVFVEGGSLTAAGGTISGGKDDADTSAGVFCDYMEISGGKVTARGGAAPKGMSYGIIATTDMSGGILNASGGQALYCSAGCSSELNGWSGEIVLTGGNCPAASYGIAGKDYDPDAGVDEPWDEEPGDEEPYEPDPYENYFAWISGDARITCRGNTAGCDGFIGYTSDGSDEGSDEDEEEPYEDEEGSYEDDDVDDSDSEEEEPAEYTLINGYYINNVTGYDPAVTVSSSVDGSSAKTWIAPDPAVDLYTTGKYVSVRPATRPQGIAFKDEEIWIEKIGQTVVPEIVYTPQDAELKYVTLESADPSVAEVSDGQSLTGHKAGTTEVTARCGQLSATCTVTSVARIGVEGISLDNDTLYFFGPGEKKQLNAQITPANASNKNITWRSLDTRVATVDKNGLVTSVGEGTATVVAVTEDGAKETSCQIVGRFTHDISELEIKGLQPSYRYTGDSIVPNIRIDGLWFYADYYVFCRDNVYPGTATVEIVGTGEFTGTKELTFRIVYDEAATIKSGRCGDRLEWTITRGQKLLITGSGDMDDFTAPETKDDAPWNDYDNAISGIWIQEGCTGIGDYAFAGLAQPRLYDISMADSVTRIGNSAFAGAIKNRLYDLKLPAGLRSIGDKAFEKDTGLYGELEIPPEVDRIGKAAFEKCENLRKVSLGEKITEIPAYGFAYCKGLVQIDLPDSILRIGPQAFRGCSGLQRLDIPASVRNMDEQAFARCRNLTELRFGGDAPQIARDAFEGAADHLILMYPPGARGWEDLSIENTAICKAHDHKEYRGYIKAATFTQTGRIDHMCSVCGLVIRSETVHKLGKAELKEREFVYNGQPAQPEVTVTDTGGRELQQGKDYDLKYENNIDAGTAEAEIVFKDRYAGTKKMDFTILPASLSGRVPRAKTFSFTYSGKVSRPQISIDGCGEEDYRIDFDNELSKDVGRYGFTVIGTGNYQGEIEGVYQIVPKGTKLKKLTGGKKKIRVQWKKQGAKMSKGRISGYQIQYSTSKKFKKGVRTVTVKKYSKVSRTIGKLKSKKKYYVRIRTFKGNGGQRLYSPWSKGKAVKVK